MPKYVLIDKQVGETPLQALERFRASDTQFASLPMTYAGRLDPMASGQLLILIGDECKKRDEYTSLDKTYEFDVLFGLTYDTGDILGLVSRTAQLEKIEGQVRDEFLSLRGTHTLPYPAFSSKTVDGKQLFQHALEGSLEDIEIPSVEMTIREIEFTGMRTVGNTELLEIVENKLSLLRAPSTGKPGDDFRIDKIRARWREVLAENAIYTIASATAEVGSGTYIRSIAPLLASKLDTGGLAFLIHRTSIAIR